MDDRTKKAAQQRDPSRARLLWWATACAAVTELQRAGDALLAEPGGEPADRTAIGDAVTALVTASEGLATACPRLALFPDLLG